MVQFSPILKKSYWVLAGLGITWAVFMVALLNPWIQSHALYAHKINTGFWYNVSNPEQFGFAKGQVTPFSLNTTDGETLYCWHVLPYDVYLEHEDEIVQKAVTHTEDFKASVAHKLLRKDSESRVVINFHGNAGHVADGFRTHTYRSVAGIPKTHLLTCDYRGFGYSTLRNAPHLPTEPGLITDGISMISYVLQTLSHPSDRTVLLGQSLGTAVTTASALYFTDPSTSNLPKTITAPSPIPKTPQAFAGIVLVAPFPSLPILLQSYKIKGFFPILSPLKGYPKIRAFFENRIVDQWPTLLRLQALLTSAAKSRVHISILHARNDQEISFQLSEAMYSSLETSVLSMEGATASQERRTIHGGERVRRGAFVYRKVEDGDAATGKGKSVELEVVRFGGHNEVVGFSQVGLAVRRAFEHGGRFMPGLDVE
ncbi:alpha/beta-hydrolase [Amniculicola lignicola CBS 123094]|uniref:Alpha/beta-hydrolase n=1 Tax=Amniculicola lignicola CBS 123094 TaxID=1392246 RepID=A0A6A5WPK3_9PLEO|nr:alpha/beta-hydrolase [Amniculicola lignicola CBS 123094]